MIYWVFGGSCTGKKRFIEQCLDIQTRPAFLEIQDPVLAAWIPDGRAREDIVHWSQHSHVMVRWQWGREEHLGNIIRDYPSINHTLVMLTCNLMTQLSRVALREGCLKWDADNLHGEMRNIYECVSGMANRHRLPVFYVDSTSSEQYTLRQRLSI